LYLYVLGAKRISKRMRDSREHIERAARVLTALTEDRFPDPDDVEELRLLVPDAAGKTLDEIVCDVIQNALTHRNATRGKARKSGETGKRAGD
jgi:hypothetical protein